MSMVAMFWSWIFPVYSFLPFRLDLSGLGVGVPSQILELALDWVGPRSSFSYASGPLV